MRATVKYLSALISVGLLSFSLIETSFAASTPAPISTKLTTPVGEVTLPESVQSMGVAKRMEHATYLAALSDVKNGRDLALADSKASLQQELNLAGRDKGAQKAAQIRYQGNNHIILKAYREAIANALESYRRELASLAKK